MASMARSFISPVHLFSQLCGQGNYGSQFTIPLSCIHSNHLYHFFHKPHIILRFSLFVLSDIAQPLLSHSSNALLGIFAKQLGELGQVLAVLLSHSVVQKNKCSITVK